VEKDEDSGLTSKGAGGRELRRVLDKDGEEDEILDTGCGGVFVLARELLVW